MFFSWGKSWIRALCLASSFRSSHRMDEIKLWRQSNGLYLVTQYMKCHIFFCTHICHIRSRISNSTLVLCLPFKKIIIKASTNLIPTHVQLDPPSSLSSWRHYFSLSSHFCLLVAKLECVLLVHACPPSWNQTMCFSSAPPTHVLILCRSGALPLIPVFS